MSYATYYEAMFSSRIRFNLINIDINRTVL